MTRRTVLLLLAVRCGVVLLLAGCGGGDGGSAEDAWSGSGTITSSDLLLADGSYGDTFHFTAHQTGWYCVEMMSTRVDAFVDVWAGAARNPESSTDLGSDDDSGDGCNARLNVSAQSGNASAVRFCTDGAAQFDADTWCVRKVATPIPISTAFERSAAPGKRTLDFQAKIRSNQ